MIIVYVVLGLFVVMALSMLVQNNRAPQLGVTDGRLAPVPKSPNAVSTQTEDPTKRVEPLPFGDDLAATRTRVLSAVEAYGGSRIVADDEHYIRVEFTTPGMRFKDDAEFYFDEAHRLVHFRSASRVGHSDMGLNRRRYEELRSAYLDQEGPK